MQPESAARPFSELEPDPLPEARGPGECLLSYPNVNADIVIPAKERHPRERTSPPRKRGRESEYPSSFPRKNVTPAKAGGGNPSTRRHSRESGNPSAAEKLPAVVSSKDR